MVDVRDAREKWENYMYNVANSKSNVLDQNKTVWYCATPKQPSYLIFSRSERTSSGL